MKPVFTEKFKFGSREDRLSVAVDDFSDCIVCDASTSFCTFSAESSSTRRMASMESQVEEIKIVISQLSQFESRKKLVSVAFSKTLDNQELHIWLKTKFVESVLPSTRVRLSVQTLM